MLQEWFDAAGALALIERERVTMVFAARHYANTRLHAEIRQFPIERFEATGPHRQVDPDKLREAFRWSVTRKGHPDRKDRSCDD